ncbi:zinc-binding alcohol dehydrogenase family protein [Propionicicella superfundia]|uniref:zinc-binding alcohol dehydrogenase family protein n=1 Tax=Propionicicella superfundia TaxID=348582 RepID=UPI00040CC372|nr:zinc-binding alcohol dehydrogenase family protein [Propionicicella superfundia]
MSTMRAVGYRVARPVTDPESLIDLTLARPVPGATDILVEVRAVSVNPVDAKQRIGSGDFPDGRVLGYDAAGVVAEVGPAVTRFKPGDEVFYAGDVFRNGSNAEFQAVDEQIVALKPASLSFTEAAAIPLTAVTAWEGLFDRLQVGREEPSPLLVLGGAGGVASMVIQLARQLTRLEIIATASRPESRAWVTELGAHHVVDHTIPLADQVLGLAPDGVRYVFSAYTKGLEDQLFRAMAPESDLVMIDSGFDAQALKQKSIALHWEWMFTRPVYRTASRIRQHELLTEVARMVDAGALRTTLGTVLHGLSADVLREGHRLIETGRTTGKIVVEF